MRKILALFLCFTLTTALWCEEVRREPKSKCVIRENLYYFADEQTSYTGIVFNQYENGQLQLEVNFKDGKQEGVLKDWHENGQLRQEGFYKDGKQEGVYKEWNEDRSIRMDEVWKDGVQIK
ncbi:MAG: hypothetical protein Q8M94_12155 [Ignavibacteria bacterium]|nr:hypothetical protein [Ignavibacteria bacterium]